MLATVAPSCGDDDDGTEPAPTTATTTTPAPDPPRPDRRGVALLLDRDTAQPGDTLRLTVENRTRTRLEYGLVYRLEHWTGERWRWINRDAAFALILKIAEPGAREHEDIGLPNDLEPGRYRIVKSFTAPATERRLTASVEFRVP